MNSGQLFIGVFRWVLLLLTALVFEKSIDGVVARVTPEHQQFFQATSVLLPNPIDGWSLPVNTSYLLGILEMLVVIILLFRYFSCLIEPVAQVCRTNGPIDFSQPTWRDNLANASMPNFVVIIFVSLFEFILIVHAALAIPSTEQWTIFLFVLAVFDLASLVLVVPLVALGILCVRYVKVRVRSWRIMWRLAMDVSAEISGATDSSNALRGTNAELATLKASRAEARREWGAFRRTFRNWYVFFLIWDALDAGVALVGFIVIKTWGSEVAAVVSVFVLTLIVSCLNLARRGDNYRDYLGVLVLAR